MLGLSQSFDNMQRNAALLKRNVAPHREGMARGTEGRQTRSILAHADTAREETRVVACAAL